MHVVYICNEYPPVKHGGLGSVTQTLARAMVSLGHEISVVGIYPELRAIQIEKDAGVNIIRLPHNRVKGTSFLVNSFRLRSTIRAISSKSTVHVVEGPELSFAFIGTGTPGVKLIRMHGGHHFFRVLLNLKPVPWRAWQEKRSFTRADHYCAVSRFVGDFMCTLMKLDNAMIPILPNPVDTSQFRPQVGDTEQAGLIIFTGTVVEKKGVRELIQAMSLVIRSAPHARLWIVGRDTKHPETGGSYIEHLREEMAPEVRGCVEFRGPITHADMPTALARAQVCVFPSHLEAQGLAILEGMAMAKAVVTSSTGPGPELVEDGVNGLLCDPHDPLSIAESILLVLGNQALRERLAHAARERVSREFSVEQLVPKNEAWYKQISASQFHSNS